MSDAAASPIPEELGNGADGAQSGKTPSLTSDPQHQQGGGENEEGGNGNGDEERDAGNDGDGGDDAQQQPQQQQQEGDGPDDGNGTEDEEDDSQDGDEEQEGEHGTRADADDLTVTGIAANEVKNIILQVLSPYFDDDGGAGSLPSDAVSPTLPAGPDEAVGRPAGGGGGATGDAAASGNAAGGNARGAAEGSSGQHGGGADGADGAGVLDDEDDTAQRYDHVKSQSWIQLMCDGIMERLIAMGKPYKFVTHIMVMRKCGAGMHICSSNYYSQTDGWLSHAHDLSPYIYAVVTIYWMAI